VLLVAMIAGIILASKKMDKSLTTTEEVDTQLIIDLEDDEKQLIEQHLKNLLLIKRKNLQ
jgi:hypothetical protein